VSVLEKLIPAPKHSAPAAEAGGLGGGGRAEGGAGGLEGHAAEVRVPLFLPLAALEATQGQLDVSFSQLPYKCNLEEVASVGD
jgi:hypothetical protein